MSEPCTCSWEAPHGGPCDPPGPMTRRYPPHAWERPGFGSLRPFPRRVDWHRMRAVLRNARSKERRFNVMRPFWDYREGMAAVRRLKLLDVYRASP